MYNHINRMVLLTGTPSPNGLIDLWAQVYLLDRGQTLGKTYTAFREHYFDPDQRGRDVIYSYKPKANTDDAIMSAIAPLCISMIVYDTVPVVLDTKAKKAYESMERDAVLEVFGADEEITAMSAAALSNKLQQLANGAVYDDERNVH